MSIRTTLLISEIAKFLEREYCPGYQIGERPHDGGPVRTIDIDTKCIRLNEGQRSQIAALAMEYAPDKFSINFVYHPK